MSQRKIRRSPATVVDLEAAAYLLSENPNIKQEAVSSILGLSHAVTSRLLKRAREDDILVNTIKFDRGAMKTSIEEIICRLRPATLQPLIDQFSDRECQKSGPVVRVFPGHHTPSENTLRNKEIEYQERVKNFGQEAAGYVWDLLRRSRHCGISWGITLSAVADGITALRQSKSLQSLQESPEDSAIEFYPLCGERLGKDPTRISASSLAAQLDAALNSGLRDKNHSRSLRSVPAFIPQAYRGVPLDDKEIEGIKKLIDMVQSSVDTFGYRSEAGLKAQGDPPPIPKVEKIDSILTSLGAGKTLDYIWGTAGITRIELEKAVFGNICGCFIPKPGHEKDSILTDLKTRWTGARFEQLQACSDRAYQNEDPGVIVVSVGAAKSTIVKECIRNGIINYLIIDSELADQLENDLIDEGVHIKEYKKISL